MAVLHNRTIVVTGASSGFGKGAALRFAQQGANLVLAARRRDLLNETAEKCRQVGGRAIAVPTDVSDPGQVHRLAESAIGKFGRVHIWINNAGVATFGRYDDTPWQEHEQVIRTNLLGCMAGSYVALQHFRRFGEGTLINISSVVGLSSAPYHTSYTASKHGIRGLDMALRQELYANGETGIHVCTVMPASFDTPFFEHAANHTGKPVKPIPPVYNPEAVTDAIYELALNPQDEVMVGTSGKVMKVVGKLAPQMAEHMMARNTHRNLMRQHESESDSQGNVFVPMSSGREMHGGWKNGGIAGKAVGVTLSAAAVGAAAFLIARRRRHEDWRNIAA